MLQEITLQVGGRAFPAVVARPEGRVVPGPAVVVIHDITGFRDDTRRHCARFAEAGYIAIAPDLYDGYAPACIVRTLASMVRERGGALPVVASAREWLAQDPQVDASRIGVVGFCMGGGFALLSGADESFAVAAPFYGPVPRNVERLRGICPTLGQFGGDDRMFRPDAQRLSRHLAELGVEHEVLTHPGAGHGFMNNHPDALYAASHYTPMRVGYNAEAEAVAWTRLLAFFAEHL